MLKALFRILDLLRLEPGLGTWDMHKAVTRSAYLKELERRFGRDFVATVRSVCSYPVTSGWKTRICGKAGTHDGIIGMLCDEHWGLMNRLTARKIPR